MKTVLVVLSVVAYVSSVPVSSDDSVLRAVIGNLVNCNSDFTLCLKEHALKISDKLGAARKLKIFDGVTLLNSNPKEARSLETLSDDPAVRNKQVTDKLWEKSSSLLQSTELELSYAGADDDDESESRTISDEVDESRGKKKKQIKKKLKILIPLLLLAKAKAIALTVGALVVIAASLFKIALIAKIAFIIKIIAFIKSLLAKKHMQEEVSWEPHGWDSHSETHVAAVPSHGQGWESGWSRSKNDANSLAYSAYKN